MRSLRMNVPFGCITETDLLMLSDSLRRANEREENQRPRSPAWSRPATEDEAQSFPKLVFEQSGFVFGSHALTRGICLPPVDTADLDEAMRAAISRFSARAER